MGTRHVMEGEFVARPSAKSLKRKLKQADTFGDFKMRPGYLYTVVRAISARVNQNYDGWPSEELKKSYRTFVGKPVFVNHENYDPDKARGVVIAARYVENGNDKYIEVVQEIDAKRFPKLAHEIRTGGLDSVSMGAEAGFTICSYCGNRAEDVPDMCDHVLYHKGEHLRRFNRKTGRTENVLVYESCYKLSFFELSYVFDPADETAVASKVLVASKQAGKYTKEDFAIDDGKKPWERETTERTEADPAEFEAKVLTAYHQAGPKGPYYDQDGQYAGPMKTNTSFPPSPYGESDWCQECGAHFLEPHAPGCALGSAHNKWGARTAERGPENSYGTHYINEFYGEDLNDADLKVPQHWMDLMYARKVREAAGYFEPYEGREHDPQHRVDMHLNLNKRHPETGVPLWTVKAAEGPHTGLVIGHTPSAHLRDADFYVQPAGNARVQETGVKNVHAGVKGYLTPPPAQDPPYSGITYRPREGDETFVHRDDGSPVGGADLVHLAPDGRMYGHQADNWGRDHPPTSGVMARPGTPPPHYAFNREDTRMANFEARVLRAWGETEAPSAVDTLREEGSAPEDDNDDFYHYVESPKELQTPDLSEATQIDREQEQGGMPPDATGGTPGAPDPMGGAPQPGAPSPMGGPPQPAQQQYMELKIPIPPQGQAGAGPQIPMQSYAYKVTPRQLAAFERYYGHRIANWRDAIEANRAMTPEEAADYRREAMRLSTLENGAAVSTSNRNPMKGTANMARSTLADRGRQVTASRRRHFADGPLVDSGDQSRNDQGEQEEVFITETPPAEHVEMPADDESNITNTENNLVARVQRGRAQLMRDATALAQIRAGTRRHADTGDSGGPKAEVVNPTVADSASEALTGDHFESANPNDGAVETQPDDGSGREASLAVFRAFDGWLKKTTGRSSRNHTHASIRRAADDYSRRSGISVQAMFPALGIVLREARKNEKSNTKGAKMRKRADEKLEVAAPDARVDVEAPVENTTDAEAQASQFDIGDFGSNAGDNIADPDLSTDQNWAPGEASERRSSRTKTAGDLLGMRCAEAMIAAGIEPNDRQRRYALAAEFAKMSRGLIQDRTALAERFASILDAERRRKVASGGTRGAARSPIPQGLSRNGTAPRTASQQRVAANDPSNDSSLFI